MISPAQGKVIKISKVTKNQIEIEKGKGRIQVWLDDLKDPGYMISIMMTPFDVHFQKAPINGKIVRIQHKKGKHRNAMISLEKALENEHQEFLIEGDLQIKIIQIAGFAARRCVSFVRESQKVQKGQDLGLIRFGSQVSLIIPKLPLNIKVGDKVKAGQTIIANYD